MAGNSFPTLGVCQVMSRSVSPWGVYVLHPSIQATGVLVRMMHHGSADALRASQKALPTEGTWGLVAWPYGDSRNGIWLGAVYTQQNDALLASSADVDYEAHPSGAYTLLDHNGHYTFAFPDGSSMNVGYEGGAVPLTRHVVDQMQKQQVVAYPNNTRQQSNPAPFPVQFVHASGTSVTIDASGNISLDMQAGCKLNITQGGSPAETLTIAELVTNWLKAHTHPSPSGESGVPSQSLTAADINSKIIEVQL